MRFSTIAGNVISAYTSCILQPERIDPPDPTKPDYDIRADVWSLGISLVSHFHSTLITHQSMIILRTLALTVFFVFS